MNGNRTEGGSEGGLGLHGAACGLLLWLLGGVAPGYAQDTGGGEPIDTGEPPTEPMVGEDEAPVAALIERIDLPTLAHNTWWNWLILFGGILLGLLAGKIVQLLIAKAAAKLTARGWPARGQVLAAAVGPIYLAMFTVGFSIGMMQLHLGGALPTLVGKTILLLVYVALFWYAFNLVDVLDSVLRRFSEDKQQLADQIVPIVRKALRIFLVVVATLFVASNIFEQNVTAWLAGFGIAALAVSLAAQDSLRNLFGAVTILLDKPFHVGERIKYRDFDGTVNEIGFRSVKIRTPTGHVVTIPNSNIVNDPVENITRRKSIRRMMNITIPYDTPADKIREAVQILRAVLQEEGIREPIHATIDGAEMPPRVFFNEFNDMSLNIFLIYWYAPPAWWDYLAHGERLNLRIFEEFERAGIDFAFPTQTLHLANDAKRQLAVRMLNDEAGERGAGQ